METITHTKNLNYDLYEMPVITYTYNRSELDKKICDTVDFIKEVIAKNDYQVKGNIDQFYNLKYPDLYFSRNQMKKIQKYCYWIQRNPSLKKINTFFSLLSKLFVVGRVQVKISLKEEDIQKARKEWLKARDEADRLLKIYKEEKGDFYKK